MASHRIALAAVALLGAVCGHRTPGVLSRVTQVQRINTRDGGAPPTGCTPERLGRSVRVAYTADDRFFTPRTQ